MCVRRTCRRHRSHLTLLADTHSQHFEQVVKDNRASYQCMFGVHHSHRSCCCKRGSCRGILAYTFATYRHIRRRHHSRRRLHYIQHHYFSSESQQGKHRHCHCNAVAVHMSAHSALGGRMEYCCSLVSDLHIVHSCQYISLGFRTRPVIRRNCQSLT